MKILKGSIHCHKQWSNKDDDRVELEIKDDSSNHIVCQIHFSLEEFAQLVTGSTLSGHPIKWFDPEHIGWQASNETRVIWQPPNDDSDCSGTKAAADAEVLALQEAEPGVVVTYRDGDIGNFHRRVSEDYRKGFNVVFWTLRPPVEEEEK